MRKYSLRHLFGVIFVCCLIVFIIRRPLQYTFQHLEPEAIGIAFLLPWWGDAYVLGFENHWPESWSWNNLDAIAKQNGKFNTVSGFTYAGIFLASTLVSIVLHIFAICYVWEFIKDTFFY